MYHKKMLHWISACGRSFNFQLMSKTQKLKWFITILSIQLANIRLAQLSWYTCIVVSSLVECNTFAIGGAVVHMW